MASKIKADQFETLDGSGNITLNNSVTMASTKTLPAASLTGALPAISGASLTSLNATNLGSGTVPTARLGSGTANTGVFLRGDGSWQAAGSTSASDLTSGTLPMARLSGTLPALNASALTAIPAANITGTLPAISGASLTNVNAVNTGRKNIIINGEMRVAQRGTSFTDPASGAYTLDRWRAGVHTSTAAANYTQSDDAPTAAQAGTNFVNCLKIDCTTADTSAAATVRYYTRYHVEGQDIAHAGFGQAGVRYMTLSFWHKHTKTGINSFGFTNNDSDRHYVAEYTQTTSDTWEKATHTFPVDTTGTWATDTGNGMTIYLVTHIGANYEQTANAWGAGNGYGTANQVNNFDSTSNNMRFTGVQLELGSVATNFEHRHIGEELALCQRYFYNLTENATQNIALGSSYTTNAYIYSYIAYPATMRVVPTLAITTSGAVGVNGHGAYSRQAYVQFYGRGSGAVLDVYFNATACTLDAEL